jgi:membrane-associated protein
MENDILVSLSIIADLRQWLNPTFILNTAGTWAIPVLMFIIFAETGLMVGFFLPGDTLLFITGLFTANSIIDPVSTPLGSLGVVLAALTAAAIIGDQVGYIIGLKVGPRLFKREESLFFKPKYVLKTKEFYDRHGGKTIVIGRFIPIIRTFAPVIAGVAQLEYRRFVVYNVFGGVIWICSMTCLGFFIGKLFEPYVKYITLGILILSVLPIITTLIQEYRLARKNRANQ